MPEPGTVTRRQAASLAGVAPVACGSGKSKGARHVRGGRKRPRDVLYMAAVAALMWNPEMKAFYSRLKERGKHSKVAITAVMRRMIVIANALLRGRRHWAERPPRRRHPANQPAGLTPVS